MKTPIKIIFFVLSSITLISVAGYLTVNFPFTNNTILSPSSTSNSTSNPVVNVYCGDTQQTIVVNGTSITPSCTELPKTNSERTVFSIQFYELDPFSESQKQDLLRAGLTIQENLIYEFPNKEFAVVNKVPVNQVISIGLCLCYTNSASECRPFPSLLNRTPVNTIASNWSIATLPDLCKIQPT